MDKDWERGDVVMITLQTTKRAYIGIVKGKMTNGLFPVAWMMNPGDFFHADASLSTIDYIGHIPNWIEWDIYESKF